MVLVGGELMILMLDNSVHKGWWLMMVDVSCWKLADLSGARGSTWMTSCFTLWLIQQMVTVSAFSAVNQSGIFRNKSTFFGSKDSNRMDQDGHHWRLHPQGPQGTKWDEPPSQASLRLHWHDLLCLSADPSHCWALAVWVAWRHSKGTIPRLACRVGGAFQLIKFVEK